MGNFFAELKRRNVYKVAVAYAIVGWLFIQVATSTFPVLEIPNWAIKLVIALVLLGFPLALIFAWAFEITPEGIKRAEDVAPNESITRRTGRKFTTVFVVVAVLAAGMFAFQIARKQHTQTDSTLRSSGAAPEKSIAVLPLVNTSGDPNNEYFSDGLSEELIAVLAKIPDLTVIGRSSSFLFKGKSSDSASIGQKLGVAHLIEGSVRKQGDRVRIVAELIKASNGRELWSDTYDRELKDVFAVQAEIAQAVADQMKVKLLGEKPRSDAAPSNQNLSAYNAVLQSDFYFRQQTAASTRRAISYADEATRLDPNYALAWAKLSTAWRQHGASFAADDADKAYSGARVAADKAISLAPDSVEALTALGWLYMNPDLNFQAAEKQFRRALELAPGDAVAKSALGYCLMAQGRVTEAERICREASLADPLYMTVWYNLGRLAVGAGRYQEAEGIFHKALEIQPQAARLHTYFATLEILRKNPRAALRHAQLESDGFWHDHAVALVLQTENDHSAAETALRSFTEKYATNGAYQVAALYALHHEPDQMFQWLDKAYTTHDSGLTQLSITPFILTYRDDPRFIALCGKLRIQVPSEKL